LMWFRMAIVLLFPRNPGGRETIIYDDYNSRVRADQNTIGTLTTMVGSSSLRSSYKLIENEE
jgi:hypothetical protein